MTTTLYAGSLAERVVDWFERNPDEELTAHDIAVKFSYRRNRVHERLMVAVREGYLTRSTKRPAIYRRGAKSNEHH